MFGALGEGLWFPVERIHAASLQCGDELKALLSFCAMAPAL